MEELKLILMPDMINLVQRQRLGFIVEGTRYLNISFSRFEHLGKQWDPKTDLSKSGAIFKMVTYVFDVSFELVILCRKSCQKSLFAILF